jgi:predicted  nucleic acid-binding Zn-ribbon protein
MRVIQPPPSAQDLGGVRELLKLISDPEQMKAALEQLRDRTNEYVAQVDAARAAQRDAADAERRAEEAMRKLETRAAQLESREKELAEREKNVTAREAKLEALRRQVA